MIDIKIRPVILIDIADLPPTTGRRPSTKFIDNVKRNGIYKPVLVRKSTNGSLTLLDGNCRVSAIRALGITNCHIYASVDDGNEAIATLSTNDLRSENLSTEAAAITSLRQEGLDNSTIGALTGTNAASIERRLRFTSLNPVLRDAYDRGAIVTSVLDQASRLPPEAQESLATTFSGRGKLTSADIKATQEAFAAPSAIATDTNESIYPEASEVSYAQLARSIHDLAERAKASGFTCSQLIDLVTSAPAFVPTFSEVIF